MKKWLLIRLEHSFEIFRLLLLIVINSQVMKRTQKRRISYEYVRNAERNVMRSVEEYGILDKTCNGKLMHFF